jgi:tetratricopeptide (TPR) repeat protein
MTVSGGSLAAMRIGHFASLRLILAVFIVSGCEAWQCGPEEQQTIRNALDLEGRGRVGDAERLLLGLVGSLERSGATEALCLAVVLNDLGSLNQDRGRFGVAESFYLRAIRLEEQHSDAGVDATVTLDNLGSVYFETGQYRKAENLRRKVIDLRISRLGPDHPSVARVIQNLATQNYAQGRLSEASELYERAFGIWRAAGSEDSPDAASAIQGLGLIFARTGDLPKGVKYVERALAIWARSLSLSAAKAEANLAVLTLAKGDPAAAAAHWRRAIETAERSTGEQTIVMREILHGYMRFLRHTGRKSEARNVKSRIDSIDRNLGRRPVPSSIIDITQLANQR